MKALHHTLICSYLFAPLAAHAQPVLLTSPTTINPGDTTIAGVPLATAEITVRGTTLTVNGRHAIASLSLERDASNQPAVVAHAPGYSHVYAPGDVVNGLHLIVAGNLTIQGPSDSLVASRISADFLGYPGGQGPGAGGPSPMPGRLPGGGGYGGAGAGNDLGPDAGGSCYGSFTQPADHGSGSGLTLAGYGLPGGGCIRLSVAGALVVDGSVSAAGKSEVSGDAGAAGSGGSIWIWASSLAGSGTIAADGAASRYFGAGSGGGGRVAVYAGAMTLPLASLQARGGNVAYRGGAGTVYVSITGERPKLIIDNGGVTTDENAEFPGPTTVDADLIVSGGASVGPAHRQPDFRLNVLGDMTIHSTARIDASGRGFGPADGPGAGADQGSARSAGGGGYGGRGGGTPLAPGGPVYGLASSPVQMGSGGGRRAAGDGGGAGGGAIRLVVTGALRVDGAISANGAGGLVQRSGGSGGGVWVTADSVAGSGLIACDGGGGWTVDDSCGGGGRVAVYTCNLLMPPSQIHAHQGFSFGNPGEPGSVVFGSGSITFTQQPSAPTIFFDGDTVVLEAAAVSTQSPPTVSYRWRRDGVPLSDGDLGGTVSGAHSPQLVLTAARCRDRGTFDVLVTDACGPFPSDPVSVDTFSRVDLDLDGFVDFSDYLEFLNLFETHDPRADFNGDGLIDFADYLEFLNLYDAGC